MTCRHIEVQKANGADMCFEPLAPRSATQMSQSEDKFNLNCLEILNNVAYHTPGKLAVDRVLELFLCVDLRRC